MANTYLILYPKPQLAQAIAQNPQHITQIHHALQAIPTHELLSQARVYGGGMYKLEPKELAAVNFKLELSI